MRSISGEKKAADAHGLCEPLVAPVRLSGEELVFTGFGLSGQDGLIFHRKTSNVLLVAETRDFAISHAPELVFGDSRSQECVVGIYEVVHVFYPLVVEIVVYL